MNVKTIPHVNLSTPPERQLVDRNDISGIINDAKVFPINRFTIDLSPGTVLFEPGPSLITVGTIIRDKPGLATSLTATIS